MHALILVSLGCGYAPAPVYKPGRSEGLDALCVEAERADADYMRLWNRFLESASETEQSRAEIRKELHRLNRILAERYTKVFEAMDKMPGAAARQRADGIAMRAAKAWCQIGEYTKALKMSDRIATHSLDVKLRVEALGCCVTSHTALKQNAEARKRLIAMRWELPALTEEERKTWDRWLPFAEGQVKAP